MQIMQDSMNLVNREAIAVFARTSRSGKRETQLNANAFSCHLRISAVNNKCLNAFVYEISQYS